MQILSEEQQSEFRKILETVTFYQSHCFAMVKQIYVSQ